MLNKIFYPLAAVSIVVSGAVPLKAADDSAQVLNDLHHSNQMEIQMGKLAQKQAGSDVVKKFGDTLVKDHSDADKKVLAAAKSQNIKLADDKMPMGDEQQAMDKLTSLQGKEFDRAFAQAMVDGHNKAITQLQAAQNSMAGTPAGNVVSTVLPVIEKHEQIASNLVTTLQ